MKLFHNSFWKTKTETPAPFFGGKPGFKNLADIGGLAIAYDAFKMTKQGQGTEKIDGFTPDQRFFLGYAQVWRLKNRDETLRSRITTDPHSPEMYRVNGPAANFTPFYDAFNIKEGDKMYIKPEDRAKIW